MNRRRPLRQRARLALRLALPVLLLCACSTLNPFSSGRTAKLTEAELRDRLHEFVMGFTSSVELAADNVARSTDDRTTRRRTLTWKIQATEVGHQALLTEPPMSGFIDLWTLTIQMQAFFERGDGRDIFGDQQALAIDVAREQVRRIEALGGRLLDEGDLETAREAVYAFAAENPMRTLRGRATNRPSGAGPGALSRLESIVTLPLAPFRVFSGVNEGAQAIREFTTVADRFTDIVRTLPEQTAWQTQLLLYDVEDRETLRAALASMEEISASSASMADTAARLPDEMRATLDQLSGQQPELRATLAEARAVMSETLAALERADAVTVSLRAAADDVAEAGVAWEGTARAFGLSPEQRAAAAEASAGESGDGGFDLETLGRSARDVTAAATELRVVIEEFDRTLRGEGLDRLDAVTREALALSATSAREVTDHAFWRGVQLVGVIFAAALLYRLLTRSSRAPAPRA
ncbi:MAG: hypothetical protein ACYTCU_03045 [Planctomycetota bacterium]|jgi:hypothetical protein